MGLASAPSAFQYLLELIFAGLWWEMALVYLDDVIVFERNFNEHLKRLELVFQRLVENGLMNKGLTCNFFQKRLSFLGHNVSESGVEADPEKVKAVERMKEPLSLKDVRAFLGLVGSYRIFIPGSGKTAEHL